MRKIIVLIICCSLYIVGYPQVLENVDQVSQFHEGLAAIKRGDQWAFINNKGEKVIDFRNDLVTSKSLTDTSYYPIFKEGKCLIKTKIDDTYHYGYINKNGTTIIEPQFLNATNFEDGYALIIKLEKTKMGNNSLLGKSVTNKKLEEYVIDATGKLIKYLENPRGYVPASIKIAPKLNARFIGTKLVAVKNMNGKWSIHKI